MAKNVKDVRDLDNAELIKRDNEAREQMFRFKFQLAMGRIRNGTSMPSSSRPETK